MTISLTVISYVFAVLLGWALLGFGIGVLAFWGEDKAFIKGYFISTIVVAVAIAGALLSYFGFVKVVV